MPNSHKKRGKKRSLYNPSYPTSKRQKYKGIMLINNKIHLMDTIHEENINIDEYMNNMKII